MANYHKYSSFEVVSRNDVGLGLGHDMENGVRIVPFLYLRTIDNLESEARAEWISFTPEAARELHSLLESTKHLWSK